MDVTDAPARDSASGRLVELGDGKLWLVPPAPECPRTATIQTKLFDLLTIIDTVNEGHVQGAGKHHGVADLVTTEDAIELAIGGLKENYELNEEDIIARCLLDSQSLTRVISSMFDIADILEYRQLRKTGFRISQPRYLQHLRWRATGGGEPPTTFDNYILCDQLGDYEARIRTINENPTYERITSELIKRARAECHII
tara:strand:- start:11735 stop:12331 length:597 start_codon:yes stop_codon:yes gene_type:complete